MKKELTEDQVKSIEDNFKLVGYYINNLFPFMLNGENFDDYYQVCSEALCKAVINFDDSKGAFSSYAFIWMSGAVKRYRKCFETTIFKVPADFDFEKDVSPLVNMKVISLSEREEDRNEEVISGSKSSFKSCSDKEKIPDIADEAITNVIFKNILDEMDDVNKSILKLTANQYCQEEIAKITNLSQPTISKRTKKIKIKFTESLFV